MTAPGAHEHEHDHPAPRPRASPCAPAPRAITPQRARAQRALRLALLLTASYMLAEFVGGLLTNSLALLADAGHMLSDVAGLSLSLFAGWIARQPASSTRTYGYYRAEILAALVNGAILVVLAILILVEAFRRFASPPEVAGAGMMAIAAGGLAVNLSVLWVLHASREGNLNLRGAWTHVLGDAVGSVGAIGAGALILAFDWKWADPATSVLTACLVLWSARGLLVQSTHVLMEGAPSGIDVDLVQDALLGVAGVRSVHDLHVWSITSGVEALSAHVVADAELDRSVLLGVLRGELRRRFGISHVTLQIEAQECGDEEPLT